MIRIIAGIYGNVKFSMNYEVDTLTKKNAPHGLVQSSHLYPFTTHSMRVGIFTKLVRRGEIIGYSSSITYDIQEVPNA